MKLYRDLAKTLVDRLVAAAALLALSPVLLTLTLAIRRRMGSPAIFRQVRIGKDDRPFGFVKFRTMTQDRDAGGVLLPDEDRLTPFGQFLRASSLDELPQLWNVLRGDMSIIGPRPLLPEYLPLYSAVQRRRHEVKPGITGLAQVKGRNALSWEDKFALDVDYVDRCGPGIDLRILVMTVQAVVGRHGISRQGHATAPKFTGTQSR